jgi:hypothetical protein
MLLVEFHIVTQVATLAHCLEVLAPRTFRIMAKMGHCEHDLPFRKFGRLAVSFNAAPRPWVCPMESALTSAFTATT